HRGVVVSEAPLGVRPARWRFPARNRILAALVDAVVVVESRPRGGSLLTVDEALRRSVPVLAVPGSVRNPAAGGTNQLIFDGCPPARDALDVLSALGVEVARADGAPDVVDDPVLSAVGSDPASFEEIALRSDRDVAEVSLALQRLVDLGLVAVQEGWYCRVG
ncbi:MAG: DNA-processing protein DprA, partial [Acidimicrobiia bacterium]